MPATNENVKVKTSIPYPEVASEEARRSLGDLLGRAQYGGERIVITRNGGPSAALISIADLEKLPPAA